MQPFEALLVAARARLVRCRSLRQGKVEAEVLGLAEKSGEVGVAGVRVVEVLQAEALHVDLDVSV